MPWIDQSKCIGCEACIKVCPTGTISMQNGKASIDQEKCIHCGKCFSACPNEAIRKNLENPNFKKHASHCTHCKCRHFEKK